MDTPVHTDLVESPVSTPTDLTPSIAQQAVEPIDIGDLYRAANPDEVWEP
jgi:hypothetical protein